MARERMSDVVLRLESKVDDISSRLARIEGALHSEAALTHEPRLRALEVSSEGLRARLGVWGGLAGVLAIIATFIRELVQ